MSLKLSRILYATLIAFFVVSCAEVLDPRTDTEQSGGNQNEEPGVSQLVYFWFFGDEISNNTELETIDATYPSSNNAFISFSSSLEGYPNTDRNGSMERRNRPTIINYRPEGNGNKDFETAEGDMRAVQVRDPFVGPNGENTMIFHIPTDGFRDIVFSLAAKDEGSAEGLVFDYSVSSGSPSWTTDGLSPAAVFQDLLADDYKQFEVSFSEIPDASDNPNFKVRVRFDTENGLQNNGNRVTFNNVAVDGKAL